MSTYCPKESLLARKRRWFNLESRLQLDFFQDNKVQADEALKKLEEIKRKGTPKARDPPKT